MDILTNHLFWIGFIVGEILVLGENFINKGIERE